jgi:hypothetical protein
LSGLFIHHSTAMDAETFIEPGLRKLELDPASIKTIVVTHGHGWRPLRWCKLVKDKYGSNSRDKERT